ncbi:MAG: T9SS type A sorting domain-containing protein, partial [Candidatus Eisenbacteria bacterium]|nr:T9SS type A sorting domain-containing protein [Candidatus Eisenbacteria bacterium]
EIAFAMPTAGEYELVVYDVAGRRVRGFRGSASAGQNAVRWDGRDARGVPVASGVYYYRVETAAGTAKSRMVLVR